MANGARMSGEMSGESVGKNTVYLTNEESQILIKAIATRGVQN